MPSTPQPASSGFGLADVYYTLFRQKWLIISLSVVGIVVAALIYFFMPVEYISSAKVLIRYVLESKAFDPNPGRDAQVRSPDIRGETILNTEIQIMTSLDLATNVADSVGADKILGSIGTKYNNVGAGGKIIAGLDANPFRLSNVILVSFKHRNPQIAQLVLHNLIQVYLKKHIEIHMGDGDLLNNQKETFLTKLRDTERDLNQITSTNNIISIEEAKKSYAIEYARIRQELLVAETELEEKVALIKDLQKQPSDSRESAILTNSTNTIISSTLSSGVTNTAEATALASGNTNAIYLATATNNPASNATGIANSNTTATNTPMPASVPPEQIKAYQQLCTLLAASEKKESDLLGTQTEESRQVQTLRSRIAGMRKEQDTLTQKYPGLLLSQPAATTEASQSTTSQTDFMRIASLRAKIKTLNEQLKKVNADARAIDGLAPRYTELQRERIIDEAKYRFYSSSAEQAKVELNTTPGQVSSINIVQDATPAAPDVTKRNKIVKNALVGGVLGGIALAFLLELFLDQSVKRPAEIERKVGLSCSIWIPRIDDRSHSAFQLKELPLIARFLGNGKSHLADHEARGIQDAASVNNNAASTDLPATNPVKAPLRNSPAQAAAQAEISPWDPQHPLRIYYEALRDRLVNYFEVRNMTHKPKLVAVSGCSQGAGVTSIASALAGLFSETGDGKVLLVDMNLKNGAAHPFLNGKPTCSLADALEDGTRDGALLHDKLFIASAHDKNCKLPRVLPKRFGSLVPRMKASDFDYIIFDMPPVSQTSITAPLASHMDITLLVVEAEKDHIGTLKSAAFMLEKCKANVSTVLNKRRTYLPACLSAED